MYTGKCLLAFACSLALMCAVPSASAQTTWYVDDDACPGPGSGTLGDPFCSIQDALDAAAIWDEIRVAPGTYNEAIDFHGKPMWLHSTGGPDITVIDAAGLGSRVVTCDSGEVPGSILEGFTITGGNVGAAAGMLIDQSDPTVIDCRFEGNSATDPVAGNGGGIYAFQSNSIIINTRFINNSVGNAGGGIYIIDGNLTITNCSFVGNSTGWIGGGILDDSGGSTITNCTFSGNSNYGMAGINGSTPVITNSIFWGNAGGQIVDVDTSSSTVSYSDVQGGHAGTGNIDADPMMIDPPAGDLRLLPHSPCLDAGDSGAPPADLFDLDDDGDTAEPTPLDLDGNPRFYDDPDTPDTGVGSPCVDMGAYERQDPSGFTIFHVPGEYATIQSAIDAASGGDQIIVDPGTYGEVIDLLGKAVWLHSSGGAAATTIDGTGLGASVVTCDSGEGPDTILQGFTITGGNAPTGGGMRISAGSPTVTDCTFTGNSANSGGGMLCSSSSAAVTGCTFTNNHALLGAGGAMVIGGPGIPTVSDCTFSGNDAAQSGGGIYCEGGSGATVTDCTFTGNTAVAASGGGMCSVFVTGDVTVTNCTFDSNSAAVNGGGMFNRSVGGVDVSLSSFTGNSAEYGGGMANVDQDNTTVASSTFTANSAFTGGGMCNDNGSPAVQDCAFKGNAASADGGGMANNSASPPVTNCLFVGNVVMGEGGGMYNDLGSVLTMTNCTFAANSASLGGAMYNWAAGTTVNNTILRSNGPDGIRDNGYPSYGTIVGYSCTQDGYPGIGNFSADPAFIRAPDPGLDGLWGTGDDDYGDLHVQPGSPCIDAGDNTVVPPGVTTDLSGQPRFVDDTDTPDTGFGGPPTIDLGAYECQVTASCPADSDGNGAVDVIDLLDLLAAWGPCPAPPDACPEDNDGSGTVNVLDLLALLAAWGPCP